MMLSLSGTKIAQIARVCHEANRALQVVQAEPAIPISPHWDELSREMQDSIIDGVIGVLNGLTPEESHQNWMAFKRNHGWRHGPVKNEATKEHPLLVSYDRLPDNAKIKDVLFGAIVTALAVQIADDVPDSDTAPDDTDTTATPNTPPDA